MELLLLHVDTLYLIQTKSIAFQLLLQNRTEERGGMMEDKAQGGREHGPTAERMYC